MAKGRSVKSNYGRGAEGYTRKGSGTNGFVNVWFPSLLGGEDDDWDGYGSDTSY